MSITQSSIHIAGQQAQLFVLQNAKGGVVELSNWGASVLDIQMPDRAGVSQSITLAHADLDRYADNAPYFGCIVGRVAGRIAHGRFHLAGRDYQLPINQGAHHLHGGSQAMSHRLWLVTAVESTGGVDKVEFTYDSHAGENGYPGRLCVSVTYSLDAENRLHIAYRANTDAPTLCNLTHHVYFNLSGNVQRTIHEHELQVQAERLCAMDEDLLVSGDEWHVAGSDFDFRVARPLAPALRSADERIQLACGLDHYFILNAAQEAEPQIVLSDKISGRRVRVFTDQPSVVLYAHNYAGQEALRHGGIGQMHDALCIETQQLPHKKSDNGNHAFALYPEQTYQQNTTFCFEHF
ncbi:aldose epimerase family protein [Hydromonas duriensis]|uniref:Aldose 1-epimerase n=1 Tax=Hydromonas duriensis TaxID=1527608 RepID=A0A4R6YB39_9BURK|nr:aldose epimerase family protein [Hydromonas duriensis]TDR32735.1 aldose 1-epimerase [Hydromonas duriensis]